MNGTNRNRGVERYTLMELPRTLQRDTCGALHMLIYPVELRQVAIANVNLFEHLALLVVVFLLHRS